MLKRGQRFIYDGIPYRVVYVTATGALIMPAKKIAVTIKSKRDGSRTFYRKPTREKDGVLISADSMVLDLC